jgi:hypothetical protein
LFLNISTIPILINKFDSLKDLTLPQAVAQDGTTNARNGKTPLALRMLSLDSLQVMKHSEINKL